MQNVQGQNISAYNICNIYSIIKVKKVKRREKKQKWEKRKKRKWESPWIGEPIIFATKNDIAISSQFLLVNLNKRNFKILLKQRMLSKKLFIFL